MTRKATLVSLLGRHPPVDLLLHPLTLFGLALMILNDGWLRVAFPGWLTGKLSDFAAVLAYPGILAALWGLGAMGLDRALSRVAPDRGVDYSLGPAVLVGACTLTGAILAGINLWPAVRHVYLEILNRLDIFHWFGPFHYTMDPSDLLALLLLPGVWLVGRRLLAGVPAGRLRTAYRLALRGALEATKAPTNKPTGGPMEKEVRIAVESCLSDLRRAQTVDQNATLDALRDLLVRAAIEEASQGRDTPSGAEDRSVAFVPSEHYHRLRQALRTHRNRGQNP